MGWRFHGQPQWEAQPAEAKGILDSTPTQGEGHPRQAQFSPSARDRVMPSERERASRTIGTSRMVCSGTLPLL